MPTIFDYFQQFDSRIQETVQFAALHSPAFAARLSAAALTPADLDSAAALAKLPVLRKDDLIALQKADPPFGGLLMVKTATLRRIFQSPGPINEPEPEASDYWRWEPALRSLGIGPGDVVLNCFGYHLTPAGVMFEEGVRACGAAVIPGGIGNQEQQVMLIAQMGVTAYIGLPSYLKALLEKAAELNLDVSRLRKAFVTAEPLPPSLRQTLESYGVDVRQGYGTAELGNLGYESADKDGWHVPNDALVQVCDINTGEPLPVGETGEVIVTLFSHVYALIRFGTGDLSAWHREPYSAGLATPRLVGWQGRIGDAVKVRGMFLHPKQARDVLARFPQIQRYQFVITRADHLDHLTCRVMLAPDAEDPTEALTAAIRDGLKFRAAVEIAPDIAEGAPVLDDQRVWE